MFLGVYMCLLLPSTFEEGYLRGVKYDYIWRFGLQRTVEKMFKRSENIRYSQRVQGERATIKVRFFLQLRGKYPSHKVSRTFMPAVHLTLTVYENLSAIGWSFNVLFIDTILVFFLGFTFYVSFYARDVWNWFVKVLRNLPFGGYFE